jgi:hypothetical protein
VDVYPTWGCARAPTTTRGEGDDDDEARDDDNDDDASDASVSPPTDEYGTVADEAWTRGQWLLGLLVLQARSISRRSPCDRVGAVNADP